MHAKNSRPLELLLCPLVGLVQKQECVLQAKQVFSTHLIALKMVFGTNNTGHHHESDF